MSRTVIAAVVAAVIAALTVIAFFMTGKSLEDRTRREADAQLSRAHDVFGQLDQLDAVDISFKADRLAGDQRFLQALTQDTAAARLGFDWFAAHDGSAVKPDILALVDAQGQIVAMNASGTDLSGIVPKQWLDAKGNPIIPAVATALHHKITISDVWNAGDKGMMKIGVAPIVDTDAAQRSQDPEAGIKGAVVIAYAQTAQGAQRMSRVLGTQVAYFDAKAIASTSFTRGNGTGNSEEDSGKARQLNEVVGKNEVPTGNEKKIVSIGGERFIAGTVPLFRTASKDWPKEYPPMTAGALLLAPLSEAGSSAATVQTFILILGVGALGLAMLGIYLTHRRLVAQADQIETGVTDIINGNVDRTFQPVGPELDGLANGLNVMLARLLGRPEPGDEEFDDEGNPVVSGRVEFEDSEGQQGQAPDPELAALAQESEPDYYKRVYTEYLDARRQTGSPDEVSFENFIAKLKVNEGKLRAQYQCRAVRFRVLVKDNKVSLKPVPIF
ncbi:MAG TPA: MXAN_5187 C-terminal domain-containing protein [Kofleriaceae bacterium]|jgi:hypothetical protein